MSKAVALNIPATQHLTDETTELLLRAVYGVWHNNGHDVTDALACITARHVDPVVRTIAGDEYLRVADSEHNEAAYTLALGVMHAAELRATCERG